jgi:hypothetical protein
VHRRWLGMMDRGVQWGGGLGGCHVGTCSVSAGHDSYRVNNCPPAGEWQVVYGPLQWGQVALRAGRRLCIVVQ